MAIPWNWLKRGQGALYKRLSSEEWYTRASIAEVFYWTDTSQYWKTISYWIFAVQLEAASDEAHGRVLKTRVMPTETTCCKHDITAVSTNLMDPRYKQKLWLQMVCKSQNPCVEPILYRYPLRRDMLFFVDCLLFCFLCLKGSCRAWSPSSPKQKFLRRGQSTTCIILPMKNEKL